MKKFVYSCDVCGWPSNPTATTPIGWAVFKVHHAEEEGRFDEKHVCPGCASKVEQALAPLVVIPLQTNTTNQTSK